MYEKIKNISNNHIIMSCLTSVFVAFLLWGIFVAQYFLSDGVTLARNGDTARQTFPAFIEMGELISEGIIDGIDVTTINGSGSIHMNGLEWYLFYRVFAYLGKLSSPLLMFLLFFAFHTFINMYFTQRLCYRYFKMSPSLSFLIAVTNIMFSAVWFISFYVVAALVIPLIYGVICMLESDNKIFCVVSSFFYVAALTSGYPTLSCILALTVFLVSLVYGITYNINDKKRIIYRAFTSAFLGLVVCMPYLFITVVGGAASSNTKNSMSLSMAVALSSSPSSTFPKLFLFSNTNELGENTFFLGPIWLFLILIFVFTKVTTKMEKGEKVIFWIGTVAYIMTVLIDLGGVLPFEKWFYMIPIFGGIHIRRRYLHIFAPLLFLSFGIALRKLEIPPKKVFMQVGIVYVLLMIGLYVLSGENINRDVQIMELIFTVVVVYTGIVSGFMSRKFLLIFSSVLLCYEANILFANEEVTVPAVVIKNRSIVFDADRQVVLDNFVDSLPEKKIYKYVAVEVDGSGVPLYVPGNYGWYHRQNNLLSNYLKYPLHGGAVPDEYGAECKITWFDSFDANYLNDTRADFAVITEEVLNKNPDNYNLSSDMGVVPLNDTIFCAKLEKYIPRHYTNGTELVVDKNDSLDNGYFYCPTLTNDAIQSFDTNNRNYFKITVNAKKDAELQYSMFAVEQYSYYIDGEKYEPEIDYGLAYFPIPSGQHCIEIVYKDIKQVLIYWIYTIYYVLILLAGTICAIYYYRKKKNRR